ncbi:hypothetical protein D3C75_1135410 [compost metagenome]
MAQDVGGPVRQRHGHQQIRQVVVGHHQGCHGFVRIRPAGELLTGQPQGLLIMVERPGVLPRIEVAIATQGLYLPVRHAAVPVGGTDPSLHPGYRHDSDTQMIIIII